MVGLLLGSPQQKQHQHTKLINKTIKPAKRCLQALFISIVLSCFEIYPNSLRYIT